MSRKHNAQHPERGRSHYPDRLAARGLTKAPTLEPLDRLRGRQQSADWLDAHPEIVANLKQFHGGN